MVAANIMYDQALGPNVVGTVLANSEIPSLIDVSTDAIRKWRRSKTPNDGRWEKQLCQWWQRKGQSKIYITVIIL